MESTQIIFPHIHKTAGSSFMATVVNPNHNPGEVCDLNGMNVGTVRSLLRDPEARQAEFIRGHIPHGLHHFSPRDNVYITFLREPIDRAISWYYWIKDLERIDLFRRHPLRNYADSVSIKEFYANRKHSNMQTRFIAGILHKKVYEYTNKFDRYILERAKHNLKNYACFGLKEYFDESVALMQKEFGWSETREIPPQRKTKKRPSVEDLREIGGGVLEELREHHQLDLELYDFAERLFQKQLRDTNINVGVPH